MPARGMASAAELCAAGLSAGARPTVAVPVPPWASTEITDHQVCARKYIDAGSPKRVSS